LNTARQIINEIIQEGAKFTLNGGEVGLTKMVSDDLLARARKHKAEIKKIIETVKREQTKTSKVWNLVIKSCDGKSISRITMIDPSRLNDLECKEHLIKQFGKNRIIEFKERILSKSI